MILTINEEEMMFNFTEDNFYDGFESAIWSDCFLEDNSSKLSINQLKGVLSSLVKKELLCVEEYEANETVISLTESGIDYLKNTGLFDEDGYHI